MSRSIADHDHRGPVSLRAEKFVLLDRIRAGEGGHPKIRMLERRRRKGPTDATRVKQFLRIERGYLA